jgi:hypothetical protein
MDKVLYASNEAADGFVEVLGSNPMYSLRTQGMADLPNSTMEYGRGTP